MEYHFAAMGVASLVGALIGGGVIWMHGRQQRGVMQQSLTVMEGEVKILDERVAVKDRQLAESAEVVHSHDARIAELLKEGTGREVRIAELSTLLAENRRQAEEKLALLNEARQELTDVFKALSAESLQKNNRFFLELAKETMGGFHENARKDFLASRAVLDEMVKPLSVSLGKMDAQVREIEKERVHAYAGLTEQVKAMALSQAALHGQTANLVQALRTPAVRGRWGEVQLRRVVELAGMLKHCDFVEQESVETDSGRLRPDMIIHLPGNKRIVVDSKVALQGYLEGLEAETEEERRGKMVEHARQVRTHLTQLASKSYWEQFQPSPELVILFLPGENFFSAALQQDAGLIEFGADKRVILATPTTLIALLKAVSFGWRSEQITDHAERISELGKELHERIRILAGHFLDMRKGLEKTIEAYNKSVGSFEGRVLVSARKFREFDPLVQKEIPVLEPVDIRPRALRPEDDGAEG